MGNVVSLANVTKTFRQKTAVEHINFSIGQGEIVAILGPNGAGKTTTISMMLGLLKPTSGNITLFNSLPHEKQVREKIGTIFAASQRNTGFARRRNHRTCPELLSKAVILSEAHRINRSDKKRCKNTSRKVVRRPKAASELCLGACR